MSYTQTIYNRLRTHGISEAGALGMLGNWQQESGCEPNRLQGDFSPYRTNSRAYVSSVTSGLMTKREFSHDAKGFGLAQWTYFTRKEQLYDFWKTSGKALDDAEMQVDFAVSELKRDYADLWAALQTTNDVFTATSRICREFERPAYNNIDARLQSAKVIKAELDLNAWEGSETADTSNSQPSDEIIQPTEFWPPRVVCEGMSGADIEVLQAVLKARGLISTNPDGIFGSYLETVVKKFQAANDLVVDGIVGNKTWSKLLEL